jgi:hypothetical protein
VRRPADTDDSVRSRNDGMERVADDAAEPADASRRRAAWLPIDARARMAASRTGSSTTHNWPARCTCSITHSERERTRVNGCVRERQSEPCATSEGVIECAMSECLSESS